MRERPKRKKKKIKNNIQNFTWFTNNLVATSIVQSGKYLYLINFDEANKFLGSCGVQNYRLWLVFT